jgi:hypothetical protein
MVVTPALRGMFGLDVDGLSGLVRVDPHLPADWDRAEVNRLHVGRSVCSLEYQRQGQSLIVKAATTSGPVVRLETAVKSARTAADGLSIAFSLSPVEVSVPHELPLPGARTSQIKVLAETAATHSIKLELEADGGSVVELQHRRNAPKLNVRANGARISPKKGESGLDSLIIEFPSGGGYKQQTVTLQW